MTGNPESTITWDDWIQNGGDYTQAEELDALVPMVDAWQTAPMGGEFTSSYTLEWMLKDNLTATLKMLTDSHVTFLGPKSPLSTEGKDESFDQGINLVLQNMGYRYSVTKSVVTKSSWSSIAKIDLTWTNTGVAPMYWDWPTYLYVLDNENSVLDKIEVKINLSELLPNSEITTQNILDLSKYEGKYIKLCVGIVDPLTNEPAVSLVSDNEKIDLLSVVSKVIN